MSERKILVIDDSATIRRLVDSSLSGAGYQVTLAATAEDGLRLAAEIRPDVILLDHQLPGTTGTEVCRSILQRPELQHTPVVISSTLRKKAYVEYTDMPNVVDMLPKPYTEELLTTTVANALDTGKLVVDSQTQGTAVPEVIQQLDEPDMSGTFEHLRLRDVLDFISNAGHQGVLEVEGGRQRIFFYLKDGRITGVSASGVDARELSARLPEVLQSLSPVLALTIDGRANRELDGIVELLDRKVLDPRLLRQLLRHQAAFLTLRCFAHEWKEFRFAVSSASLPLHQKLPLNVSLMALLIEGAMLCGEPLLPAIDDQHAFVRCAVRGQNLDRAGVAARHLKLLNLLNEPRRPEQLVRQTGLDIDEVRRVLCALVLGNLVEQKTSSRSKQIIVFDPDKVRAVQFRHFLADDDSRYSGKAVGDLLALQLALKRIAPDFIVFDLDDQKAISAIRRLHQLCGATLDCKWVGMQVASSESARAEQIAGLGFELDATIDRPFTSDQFFDDLDSVLERRAEPLVCSAS